MVLEAIKADTHGAIEWVYPKEEADKVIAELKKEKEYVIENTAEVINGQEREIRKLKRALWMARARTAHLEVKCFIHDMYDEDATADQSAKDEIMADKWQKVKLLCKKKAKECK